MLDGSGTDVASSGALNDNGTGVSVSSSANDSGLISIVPIPVPMTLNSNE
jgi:hypothetical protein